jgi:hypothetical protein
MTNLRERAAANSGLRTSERDYRDAEEIRRRVHCPVRSIFDSSKGLETLRLRAKPDNIPVSVGLPRTQRQQERTETLCRLARISWVRALKTIANEVNRIRGGLWRRSYICGWRKKKKGKLRYDKTKRLQWHSFTFVSKALGDETVPMNRISKRYPWYPGD